MRSAVFVALLVLCLTPLQADAWHEGGHHAVAAIAWEEMNPKARKQAAELLRNAPLDSGIRALRPNGGSEEERDRVQFIRVSTWAGQVRSGRRSQIYHQSDWHYVNYFWEQQTPGGPVRQLEDRPTVVQAVSKLRGIHASLSDPATEPVSPSRPTDLAWFVHLIGDIAQPLHCSSRISPEDPQGDQGGNLFCLSEQRDAKGRCVTNLHSYWDHAIEREFGENAEIGNVVRILRQRHPPPPKVLAFTGHAPDLRYASWARDSQQIAVNDGYPATLVRDREPPAEYRDIVSRISEKAIAYAGYRLGACSNEFFGR